MSIIIILEMTSFSQMIGEVQVKYVRTRYNSYLRSVKVKIPNFSWGGVIDITPPGASHLYLTFLDSPIYEVQRSTFLPLKSEE